jgi:alpha-L-arabinofuranosidase
LTFQRLGGDFAFANFNNFANTWGQNVIECPKDTAYLSPAGRVFALLSRSPAARPLVLRTDGQRANLTIQAAWNENRTALCLMALNYNPEEIPLDFDFAGLGQSFTRAELTVLRAESLTAYSTPTRPSVVQHRETTQSLAGGQRFRVMAAPFSLTHVVLKGR